MRHLPVLLAGAALSLTLGVPATAAAQGTVKLGTRGSQEGGYSSDSTAFVVGRRVHLRSTKTYIGVIRAVDERHGFPPDRFPRATMKAVLIEHRDGSRDWIPVERITHIYVAR
jgi:hypothetical protein